MKNKYTLINGVCLLLVMFFICAQQANAKLLTVKTEKEGTLAEKIPGADKWDITELKVSGPLNGFDFRILREMSGCNYLGEETEGNLRKLDMTDVVIIGYDQSLPLDYQSYFISYETATTYVIGGDNYFNDNLFYGCSKLEELILPKMASVTKALTGMSNLKKISVSDESQQLSVVDNVLYSKDKTKLLYAPVLSPETTLVIPAETETVCANAFSWNVNLESLVFPNVKCVQTDAIIYCQALQSISFGKQLTELEDRSIFGNVRLQSVTVAEDNPYFQNIGTALVSKDLKVLYIFPLPDNVENVTIPDGVMTVKSGALYSGNIRKAVLPNSVKQLDQYAITNCINLESLYLGSGVEILLSDFAFNLSSLKEFVVDINNPNYQSVNGAIYSKNGKKCFMIPGGFSEFEIPEGTEELEMLCLGSVNNKIKTITLPSTLKTCTTLCLSYTNLSAVNCKATVPPAGDYYPLPNYNVNNVILYVPKGTLSAYKQSPIWRIFTNMKEMDASGIEVVSENDIYEVARYSVDGKQLPKETNGLNIIKMSDGTVKKVWISNHR